MIATKEKTKESRESEVEYWGVSTCINLYDCDLPLMQNAQAIREFVVLLCDRIKMRRYGETQVVFFGDEPHVQGFSMTQLIETSLISAHFAEPAAPSIWMSSAAAPYDSQETAQFAAEYFKAGDYTFEVVHRK